MESYLNYSLFKRSNLIRILDFIGVFCMVSLWDIEKYIGCPLVTMEGLVPYDHAHGGLLLAWKPSSSSIRILIHWPLVFLDDFYHKSRCHYYIGSVVVRTDWHNVSISTIVFYSTYPPEIVSPWATKTRNGDGNHTRCHTRGLGVIKMS